MATITTGIVEIENLWYTYPRAARPALQGLNLTVRAGEFLAIMGRTGSGKTSLCLAICGLVPQFFEGGEFRGKVLVDGVVASETPTQKLASKVGLVFQDSESQIFGVTVKDDVAFGPGNFGLDTREILTRVTDSLSTVRLTGYEDREIDTLSGGEKQRLALAGVLAMKPKILLLDEPTSQIDPVGKDEVFLVVERLREDAERTVIIVEHRAEEIARYADRIVVMDSGKIALEGSPREVFGQVDRLYELGVRPPQVCELAHRLAKSGLWSDANPLTEDELLRSLPLKRTGRKDVRMQEERLQVGTPIIEVMAVDHVYPGGREALREVNLTIRRGEFLAIIGQNGSGKTTLVKHFNGLLKPTRGSVVVDGLNTARTTIGELSKRVGYIFQNPDHQIFARTVREEVAYGPKNMKLPKEELEKRVNEALEFVDMQRYSDSHPFLLAKGERQRVAFASIVSMRPEVLVVDEPTTGQDYEGRERMMKMLSRLNQVGHTVVIVTHEMTIVAEYCRRVVVLNQGRIVLDGPTRRCFSQLDVLKESFLAPPQITRAGFELGFSDPNAILTVDEFVDLVGGD